jgi:DNA-binding MarR family transcriptional regulator
MRPVDVDFLVPEEQLAAIQAHMTSAELKVNAMIPGSPSEGDNFSFDRSPKIQLVSYLSYLVRRRQGNMKRKSDPFIPALTEAVFHSFLRSWGLLRQAQDPYFARLGISASQWGILRVLQRAELKGERELPLKAVSERLLIQPPSVTGVVDRLERQGFVKRRPAKTDLRVRHLSLTPRGRGLMANALTGHAERIQLLFAGLQPHEQDTMLSLLQRLEEHLRTLVSPPPDIETSSKGMKKKQSVIRNP